MGEALACFRQSRTNVAHALQLFVAHQIKYSTGFNWPWLDAL
jgi:hypothetical protein